MLNNFYKMMFLFGITAAVLMYIFRFDEFSETEMVRVAYVWVPMVVFGAAGYLNRKKGASKSIVAAVGLGAISILGLMLFFEFIFPEL